MGYDIIYVMYLLLIGFFENLKEIYKVKMCVGIRKFIVCKM